MSLMFCEYSVEIDWSLEFRGWSSDCCNLY